MMKTISEMKVIPITRMRRELTSILRRGETVAVSVNGEVKFVLCPRNTEEFDIIDEIYGEPK